MITSASNASGVPGAMRGVAFNVTPSDVPDGAVGAAVDENWNVAPDGIPEATSQRSVSAVVEFAPVVTAEVSVKVLLPLIGATAFVSAVPLALCNRQFDRLDAAAFPPKVSVSGTCDVVTDVLVVFSISTFAKVIAVPALGVDVVVVTETFVPVVCAATIPAVPSVIATSVPIAF
ncbi:MAG TPA: hypothetical protein VNM40_03030 [Candidatus Paceibacterota bacterium]|nr:hypothetical protein [Candidatus Paceibacterota bacterium]